MPSIFQPPPPPYSRSARASDQQKLSAARRPTWAIDVPTQPFKQHALLLTLDHTIPINTPFAGPYYESPRPPPYTSEDSQSALAVFARFSYPRPPTLEPYQNLWIAIRVIHTHENENQRSVSLTWVPFIECAAFLKTWCVIPGYQIFEPKQEYKRECSEGGIDALDVKKVWNVWKRGVISELDWENEERACRNYETMR
ncbi:hypothetical protein DM02DRAFT_631012 [Periconia macrospinosa]|uniref:Uncharacterized protein n=1 Tax=Periconia macrospinosa TaxID=97972 RepID=A0A2V1DJY1_9PLEO|nr:hypothetical protein DM02DRAFT_631012 [Periconia macrospinosa]